MSKFNIGDIICLGPEFHPKINILYKIITLIPYFGDDENVSTSAQLQLVYSPKLSDERFYYNVAICHTDKILTQEELTKFANIYPKILKYIMEPPLNNTIEFSEEEIP